MAWRLARILLRWFGRPARKSPVQRLAFEALECRDTPTLGVSPWPDPQNLSLSFAPDGTTVVGEPSVLSAAFDQSSPERWQREILRAVQSWVVHAHLNVSLCADDGSPFGIAGRLQGDPRFGDIRLGALPMTGETLATAVRPGRTTPGTWAGDIIFNSAVNHAQQNLDLFTIALHEIGHALGLRDTTQPNSVMNFRYTRSFTAPTSADIAELQKLYGPRPNDPHEGRSGNNTLRTATRLDTTPREDFRPDLPMVVYGDITRRTDVDFYAIRPAPNHTGPMTFRVQTAGVSLLNPSLAILDSRGRILSRASTSTLGGGFVQLTLDEVNPQSVYYIRIQGATSDVFGMGRYSLAIIHGELPGSNGDNDDDNDDDDDDDDSSWTIERLVSVMTGPFESLPGRELQALIANPDHLIYDQDDDDDDDDGWGQITPLPTAHGYATNTHFVRLGSLSALSDTDVYQITAPSRFEGQIGVLTATIWGIDGQSVAPTIRLFNVDQQELPGTILANGDGSFTIQATQIQRGAVYYVQIGAEEAASLGNYELILDFSNRPADVVEFAAGSLTAAQTFVEYDLFVAKTQVFHVLLEARGNPVTVNLYDEQGNWTGRLVAGAGQVVSGSGWALKPGRYQVRIESTGLAEFRLYGMSIYDWIGPIAGNPATEPKYSDPSNPNQNIYPTPNGPVTSLTPFLWSLRLF
ncbi:MAG: matrixin family metalloprotease [Gemmataceae bacterium]|nr:matrixin family metalloprotease [Gemmataceae bacterium]